MYCIKIITQTTKSKEYLTEALGDLETYIYNRIEANIKLTK